jgi:hypothetical protein
MHFRELGCECVDWINLPWVWVPVGGSERTIMLRVRRKEGDVLTGWATASFSRRSVFRGVSKFIGLSVCACVSVFVWKHAHACGYPLLWVPVRLFECRQKPYVYSISIFTNGLYHISSKSVSAEQHYYTGIVFVTVFVCCVSRLSGYVKVQTR